MKLAEALIERADLQKRIEQLNVRLSNNARVQDGELPAENPVNLLAELDTCIARLEDLICRINLTNSNSIVEGKTLTAWIAHRDCLNKKTEILRNFLYTASQLGMRSGKNEIIIRSTISVEKIQKEVDLLAKELRETDTKIQAANWTTDLL